MTIGIIGMGFVGRAVYYGFRNSFSTLYGYDVNPKAFGFTLFESHEWVKRCDDIQTVAQKCDIVFVCVSTPSSMETGKIDTSIVEEVVGKIIQANKDAIVVIKSTVIPGTTNKLRLRYPGSHIVFNPEFLTEKNYVDDFLNQKYVVLGGDQADCYEVGRLYRHHLGGNFYKHIDIHWTDARNAEMLKYVTNCMLAAKVGLCNEFKRICDAANINWNTIVSLLNADDRIGKTHLQVPGSDGNRGFGGKCFPKDMIALIGFAKEMGVDPKVLSTIWEENLKYRRVYDWLEIPGAVIGDEKKGE